MTVSATLVTIQSFRQEFRLGKICHIATDDTKPCEVLIINCCRPGSVENPVRSPKRAEARQ